MIKEEISNAIASFEIPVQWGDMDAAQHVNNLEYLRWVESVRIEFLKKINYGNADFNEVGPILAWHDCKYIFPVTYPDDIAASYNVIKIEGDKMFCEAKLFSKKHNRLVAISNNTLVAYNYKKFNKVHIPHNWLECIVEFYGNTIVVSND